MITLLVLNPNGRVEKEFYGDQYEILEEMDFMTEEYEKRKVFMVEEVKIDGSSYIRKFATVELGYVGSIVTFTERAKHVKFGNQDVE